MLPSFFSPSNHKIIIYQLLVRLFGNANAGNKMYGTIAENGCGKFNDINEQALAAIKELGITHIWFTGILEHSSLTAYPEAGIAADDPHIVKGRAGSPYAIRDYYDVDADLAVVVPNRLEEFDALIQRTHAIGMKALIDFVPNHLARSYRSDMHPVSKPDFGEGDDDTKLFDPQNNFLYLTGETFEPPADYRPLAGAPLPPFEKYIEAPAKVTGNDVYANVPGINDWFETIKLNFGVSPDEPHTCYFDPIPKTWQMLLEVLLYWCKKGVDGFRCDMAEMVPAEFWEWIIPCVKTHHPDVLFIGEIYKPELYVRYLERGCFDYLYDKVRLYDTLCGIIRQQTSADELTECARSVEKFSEKMLSFLENHDEERLAWSGFAGDPNYTLPAMTVCATLSKGPVMVYCGQEVGEPGEGNVGFAGARGRTSIFDYAGMPELQKWTNNKKYDGKHLSASQHTLRKYYQQLLNLCTTNEALSNGSFYDLQYINRFHQSEGYDERYIFSFLRYTENERVLVLVNFNRETSYDLVVKIPDDAWRCLGLSTTGTYRFTDLLSGTFKAKSPAAKLRNTKDRNAGLPVRMAPLSSYVIDIR
jgi:glycosidase